MLKIILIVVSTSILGMSTLYADINQTKIQEKKISYQEEGHIIMYARSGKKSYTLGESIGIELKLKRDAYIYFWTVSQEGTLHMILPNALESYNRYKKNIAYTVPEHSARYSFVPAIAGIEEIYVLANPAKLTGQEVKNIIIKERASQKLKEEAKSKKDEKKCGIMVVAKKPPYDIAHLKIIVYPNQENVDSTKIVKIATNPYGSTEGYYPVKGK